MRCPRVFVASSSRVRSTRDGDRIDEEMKKRYTEEQIIGFRRLLNKSPSDVKDLSVAVAKASGRLPRREKTECALLVDGRHARTIAVNSDLLDDLGEGQVPKWTGHSPRRPPLAPMGRGPPADSAWRAVDLGQAADSQPTQHRTKDP